MKDHVLVKNGSPDRLRGAKPVTIQDVAREMGLAKSTVSKALNARFDVAPETREAVLRTARRLGFEPNALARRLSSGTYDDTIGIVATHLDWGVATAKIKVIQGLLSELGYSVPLLLGAYGPNDEERQIALIKAMRGQRPRAIICSTAGLLPVALDELEPYQRDGGLVASYDMEAALHCDKVIFDRCHNTFLAARHLVELGHREIGFSTAGLESPASRERVQGFRRALVDAGITVRPEWLWDVPLYEAGGAELAERFLRMRRRPSALCIVNDDATAAFIGEVGRAGIRVPEDLSVVGHDDLPNARYFPVGITTVSHPVEAIAAALVEMVKSRLDGSFQGPPRSVVVRGELVVRSSAIAIQTDGSAS